MSAYAPPGTVAEKILTIVTARPGVLVADLPALVGAPREAVVPEVWRLCRDAVLASEARFGRVALAVAP